MLFDMFALLFYELRIVCWNVGDHKRLAAAMLHWQWCTTCLFLNTIRPQPQLQSHQEITKIYNHWIYIWVLKGTCCCTSEYSPHCLNADPHRPHVLIQLHPSAVGFGCLFCFLWIRSWLCPTKLCSFFFLVYPTVQLLSMVSMVICPPKGCTEDPTGSGKLVRAVYIIFAVAMELPPPPNPF